MGGHALVAAGFFDVVAFHPHLDIWGLMLGLALGYELGIRRLAESYAPRGEPVVTRRQRRLFYAGVLLVGIVSSWPIHDIGEQSLFTFHMTEHVVMAFLAPPLLLLGTPWWLLRAILRPIMPVMRILTRPVVALVLFNGVLAAIHAPVVLEAMLTNDAFHLAAHSALFLTAVLMWWPVIGPLPELPRLAPFGKMGYLFLQSLVPTIPASFLTLATAPVYRIYEDFPRLWDLSVLTDQIVAGFIMKFGGGAIIWTAIAIVFFSWHAEEERLSLRSRVRTTSPG